MSITINGRQITVTARAGSGKPLEFTINNDRRDILALIDRLTKDYRLVEIPSNPDPDDIRMVHLEEFCQSRGLWQ